MARIIAIENVTLDGVMQAPAAPDEDTRGGFPYGGWGQPYGDEISMQKAREGMASEGAMLFGRVTYERFLKVWAGRKDNPFSPVLDARHKYVVSTTLTEPLAWQNSTLVGDDVIAAVRELKERAPEENLGLLGSGVLLRSLLAADLVDELQLSIAPLVLGTGTRLFAEHGPHLRLRLTESVTTTTGVMLATYRRGRHNPVPAHLANALRPCLDVSPRCPRTAVNSQRPLPAELLMRFGLRTVGGSADCCQICCQATGQCLSGADRYGMSAQRISRDGRSWSMCPLLRIRRVMWWRVHRDPGSPVTHRPGICTVIPRWGEASRPHIYSTQGT